MALSEAGTPRMRGSERGRPGRDVLTQDGRQPRRCNVAHGSHESSDGIVQCNARSGVHGIRTGTTPFSIAHSSS